MRKALIIDDELNSQDVLAVMLREYCTGIEVCGFAGSVEEGILQIKGLEPDLVFLDMEIPGGDGFAVLDAFPEPNFEIVVVSGYTPALLRQLNYAALAYLTKPIVLQEVQELVANLPQIPIVVEQVDLIREVPEEGNPHPKRLILAIHQGYASVELQEIAFIEAQRTYSRIVLGTGGEHIATHPLRHYEDLLPQDMFFRVHKSYLLNLSFVKEYDGGRTGLVRLRNGQSLPIAARRKSDFIRAMKGK